MKDFYDVIIIGCGSSGFGSSIRLSENSDKSILIVDKLSGGGSGLLNDCKANWDNYRIGFPPEFWKEDQANKYMEIVKGYLNPVFTPLNMENLDVYVKRAKCHDTELVFARQSHVGTDKARYLIDGLIERIKNNGVEIQLKKEVVDINYDSKEVIFNTGEIVRFGDLIISVGRKGAFWFQDMMKKLEVNFSDNIVDIGIRVETMNYPIVKDFYDPKFIFNSTGCRTFCTNSGKSGIVQESYGKGDDHYYSVNGHALSDENTPNNLINFAILKTITLTDPITSGIDYARALGKLAMIVGGGRPVMQRVGDIRLNRRSKKETFNNDYMFKPTLGSACAGNVQMCMPGIIWNSIWKSLKILDSIVPGVLDRENIIYYPEIKTYSTRPYFIDDNFQVKKNIFVSGDSAFTSRGITSAMCSGVRVADGILSR